MLETVFNWVITSIYPQNTLLLNRYRLSYGSGYCVSNLRVCKLGMNKKIVSMNLRQLAIVAGSS